MPNNNEEQYTNPGLDLNGVLPSSSNIQYVIAILTMFFFGIILSIAIIALRPAVDALIVIGTVFGFLSPTTLALMSFMKGQQTHSMVNGRLTQYIQAATMAAGKDGFIKGQALASTNPPPPVPIIIVPPATPSTMPVTLPPNT